MLPPLRETKTSTSREFVVRATGPFVGPCAPVAVTVTVSPVFGLVGEVVNVNVSV